MSPNELQQEVNDIIKSNEPAFKAMAELLMNDVEALCLSHDITEPDEISAVMNTAHFNFEFKFGFYLAMAKLKIQTTGKTTERDIDEFDEMDEI